MRKGSSLKVISGSSGSADGLLLQVSSTARGVDQLAVTHAGSGRLPSALMVKSRRFWSSSSVAVLYNRLAGIVRVYEFFSCTHKLHFRAVILQLRRPEILEDGKMRPTPQTPGQRLGHGNAAAHHHHIDVLGRTLQEYVAHVAADYVALQSQFIRRFGYPLEYARH